MSTELELRHHNQLTYTDVLCNLENHNKVAVVQATGTGKGVLASSLIMNAFSDKTVSVLVPNNSILFNYRENLCLSSNNVSLNTYAHLLYLSDEEFKQLGDNTDILFLDEFHRTGAPKWGDCVLKLIDIILEHGGKVIGLSATSKRYLDNQRDMVDEIFDGNVILGVDLSTAIMRGILPPFKYIVSLYGYKKLAEGLLEDTRIPTNSVKISGLTDEISKLMLLKEEDRKISDIVQKEIKNLPRNQKWVVFCNNIDELDDMPTHLYRWFNPHIKITKMHSKLGKSANNETLKNFNAASSGINILLTVDMLNEGVHIKGLTGIFMLRKTVSPIVFLQQLGRALSSDYEISPIIFDFIGNYRNLTKYKELELKDLYDIAEEVNSYAERKRKKYEKKGNNPLKYGKIIIENYAEDIYNVLNKIEDAVRDDNWTIEEDKLVQKYYNSNFDKLCSLLPHRSVASLKTHASVMGVADGWKFWTRKEDNIIRKYFPIEGDAVVNRLEGRTRSAVKTRASTLKVKLSKDAVWTEEEDAILKSNYPRIGYKVIFKLPLNKTIELVRSRLTYFGYDTPPLLNTWTSDEDAFLKLTFNILKKEEIQSKLRLHSWCGISARASRLGIADSSKHKGNSKTKWTESEDDFLIECYQEYGPACYDHFPDRSHRGVDSRIYKLKVLGKI